MALSDVWLSMLALPQRWTGTAIEARVLLLPTGDPTQVPARVPPIPLGLPAFAGTAWKLQAKVLPGWDALLGPDPDGTAGALTHRFDAAPPGDAQALFAAIGTQFPIAAPKPAAARRAALSGTTIRKHLPSSYTEAFAFERPGPNTSIGDEFGCALRDTIGAEPLDPKPEATITWGAVLSFALRQPELARALGLFYDITIPVPSAALLQAGGWLLFEFDPTGPVQPKGVDTLRRYAARLPALSAAEARPLFAAVVFPVGQTAASYDDALVEAAVYDDGFTKIVHAAQAVNADAASDGHNRLRVATDAGLDLGWDDEQVTVWLNRQIAALQVRLDPTAPPGIEAPLGVAGYRVDVRPANALPDVEWTSLCEAFSADASGARAPLRFPPAPQPAIFSASFEGELAVEPTPIRALHTSSGAAWLPQHFARWQDGSLVATDTTLFELAGSQPLDANGNPLKLAPPAFAADPPAVRLRYGRQYAFRCRLSDLTGGGPTRLDHTHNPAPRPVATARFVRHVPPKSVRVVTDIAKPAGATPNPAVGTISTIDVWRPLIGYPEMVFAGIDDPAVVTRLLADAARASAARDAVGVNDPDVTQVRVSMQVRAPAHDPGPADALREGDFRVLYETDLDFPAFDPEDVFDPGPALRLTLQYVDQADIGTLAPPPPGSNSLPVPCARDVRVRLTAIGRDTLDYFANAEARIGLTIDLQTRASAQTEAALFVPRADELELNAVLLQPGPDLLNRLADHLDLTTDALGLAARPGERVVFAASAALRHSLSGDHGGLQFASIGELLGHWIAVVQLQLDRDWTWDGLDDQGFKVSRRDLPVLPLREIGSIQVPFTVPAMALQGSDEPGTDRRASTRLVFLDAVDQNPEAGAFPTTPTPEWVIEPRLRGLPGAALARTLKIRLPVAVPPRQTPKLIAAGVALTPYVAGAGYASTAPRRRVLWFEFAEPVADPHDALFARVMAYGPDPLLSGTLTHWLIPVPDTPIGPTTWFDLIESLLPTPPELPALAIDPEPIRVIVPNQPEDTSGLNAMVVMETGVPVQGEASARHFIVPLPPAVDAEAAELFGFWTYELRIGHRTVWSTAQARFGGPLIAKGVQHPPPAQRCAAFRSPKTDKLPARILVSAPYATAVFKGDRLTQPTANDPRTRIWFLLYAQVTQADGSQHRNILLTRTLATPDFDMDPQRGELLPNTRDVFGVGEFTQSAVEQALADRALPLDAPLSVIAVELLPGDHLVQLSRPLSVPPGIAVGEQESLYFIVDTPDGSGFANQNLGARLAFAANAVRADDPLGADLGSLASRRILRCSPLTPVAPAC
jgi:hypothetical protein